MISALFGPRSGAPEHTSLAFGGSPIVLVPPVLGLPAVAPTRAVSEVIAP
jgi:hypothetical protein